jgi:hypothetical protein
LRKSGILPLKNFSNDLTDLTDLYYYEAQTSSLSWGNDESFWTVIFLVDTYFGSEENRREYFLNKPEGDGIDPPLGGEGSYRRNPQFDPREYFLHQLNIRIAQVATEYSALVETFNARMEAYVNTRPPIARRTAELIALQAETIRDQFKDEKDMTHTRTIGHVIETIQIFVDCISSTVEAWDSFRNTGLALFTQHAPEKLTWPSIISQIVGNIAELDSMRKGMIRKRERFRFKLETVSISVCSPLCQRLCSSSRSSIPYQVLVRQKAPSNKPASRINKQNGL